MIAGAVSYDGDAWDIVLNPAKVVSVLPIVTVLTLSATGSEMDTFALSVIWKPMIKSERGMRICGRRHQSGPKLYLQCIRIPDCGRYGGYYESYLRMLFSNVQGYMQDRMAEGLLKTCIEFGVTCSTKS